MFNLRNLRIGMRLGIGFGGILLSATALLVGAMVSNAQSRDELAQTLKRGADQEALATEMRVALLNGAIAVRNMGLQTQVEAVQKDEDSAKAERAKFVSSLGRIQAGSIADVERAPLARLAEIDARMDGYFKEAVDLASQFNTEQAGAVITGKIDPLSMQANAELARFVSIQKERTAAAAAEVHAHGRVVELIVECAGALVLALVALLAWRLTASITGPLQTAVDAAARVAHGDLASDIVVSGKDEAASLLRALSSMRDSLSRMVSEVRSGSQSIEGASTEIAQGNSDLSARTESQASALQQTASSVERLTSTVKQNADSASLAHDLSQSAADQVNQGHELVSQVVGTMSTINEHSRQIGEITTVINGIAFQTNILALNAAVEAARAGEHGRGFAVVAAEVRSLSQRSTQAAKEIETLIRSALAATKSGSDLVDLAGHKMGDVRTSVQKSPTSSARSAPPVANRPPASRR